MHWYRGQTIVFVTDHQKHLVLIDTIQEALGAQLIAPTHFDTDKFGTFTGEVTRSPNLKDVLRQKVRHGLSLTGEAYALASEGSFSNHPLFENFATDHEAILFYDQQRDIEVFHSGSTHTTSFRAQIIYKESELDPFLDAVGFPQQGVILKDPSKKSQIFKGLNSWQALSEAWKTLSQPNSDQGLWVETDNRAHMNPLRRQFLKKIGLELLEKIKTPCPDCRGPGFHCQDVERGLPCEACQSPTQNVLYEIWKCPDPSCAYQERRPRLDGKTHENPKYCDFCNP